MFNYIIPTAKNNYRAKLLTTPFLVLMAVGVLMFNTITGAVPATKVYASISTTDLLSLHNAERTKAGLGILTINSALTESAQQKAEEMLAADCWSHYCPEGKSPWSFFTAAGYNYLHAGENLAEGFSKNEDVLVAWMNSPTHQKNILKPEYTEVGFGIATGRYQGRDNNTLIVVHFGTPQPSMTAGAVDPEVPAANAENPTVTPPQETSVPNIEVDLPTNSEPATGRVISAEVKARVNTAFLVFMLILFLLDFVILGLSGITRKNFKSHLHFAMFIVVSIILISGIINGHIGNGLLS